jgi:hypothetical protein
MVGPQPAFTDSMHQWHSGLPPEPYRWVLRGHPAQRPARSPGQISADGSGSETFGTAIRVMRAGVDGPQVRREWLSR